MFSDPVIQALTEKITLPELQKNEDIYLALLDSIVSQQVSVKAADTIFKRFLALFEDNYPKPEILAQMDVMILRSAGLSGQKSGYLKNTAQFALENGLELKKIEAMSDSEIISYLTQIKGVGKWTAEMILMFSLCHPDIFPIDDLIIRQSVIKLYGLDATAKDIKVRLIEIAENWKPNRSLACRYIWKSKDSILTK